jgi:hypothetical protein
VEDDAGQGQRYLLGPVEAAGRRLPRVEHEHLAAADDVELAVAVVDDRGVFVDAHAQPLGLEGRGREQAAEALALGEVLVDDKARDDAQAGRQAHAVTAHLQPRLAPDDHGGGKRRGAC